MLLLSLVVGFTLCTSVLATIPPSNICYQHTTPRNACIYGNLSVAFIGKTLKPKDCNSQLILKDWERGGPPFIYINTTNTTERFTVIILDTGPDGTGPAYIEWMVTNVSVNTLPDYLNLSPGDIAADYREPMLLHGTNRPNLIQILVFRHQNVLRVPFGELFTVKRNALDLSQLFSNTGPNLKLCGPVAGTQYWVYESKESMAPSAPPLPPIVQPGVPPQSGYVPPQSGYIPAQPGVPPQSGYAPIQPGVPPQSGNAPIQPGVPPQSGYVPPQSGYVPAQPSVPPQSGYAPIQPGVPPQSGYVPPQSGYVPAQPGVPPQPGYMPVQPVRPGYHQPAQPGTISAHPSNNSPPSAPHQNFPKKNSGFKTKPILFVYLILLAVIFS